MGLKVDSIFVFKITSMKENHKTDLENLALLQDENMKKLNEEKSFIIIQLQQEVEKDQEAIQELESVCKSKDEKFEDLNEQMKEFGDNVPFIYF